jgi:hypothetical protein
MKEVFFMNYTIVLDVEAVGGDKPIIYDIGLAVINENHEIVETESFIIKEVYDNKLLFSTAYYAHKRKLYTNKMKGRKTKKVEMYKAKRRIEKYIRQYNLTDFHAFNVSFDKRAFEYTFNLLGLENPLKDLQARDILRKAKETICLTESYKTWAQENGYYSVSGNITTNAEVVTKYLRQDTNFIEEHTGLADVLIEVEILKHCDIINALADDTPKEYMNLKADIEQTLIVKVNDEKHEFKYKTMAQSKKYNTIYLKG